MGLFLHLITFRVQFTDTIRFMPNKAMEIAPPVVYTIP